VPPVISLCGKMEVLDRLLRALHAEGHKVRVVVFASTGPLGTWLCAYL
jgi:hypothetical protein